MAGAAFHSIDKNKAAAVGRTAPLLCAQHGRHGTACRLHFQGTERQAPSLLFIAVHRLACRNGIPAGIGVAQSWWMSARGDGGGGAEKMEMMSL